MDTGRALRNARRRAGLSQRALAMATGVAQPTIARIETGHDNPRIGTVERLLTACGETIEALPRAGVGIDRTEIRRLLSMTPAQRAETMVDETRSLGRLRAARRIV
ncbi:MAG: helix-turn-helix transcriptional regulator [Acidimicrobiales bacterium]